MSTLSNVYLNNIWEIIYTDFSLRIWNFFNYQFSCYSTFVNARLTDPYGCYHPGEKSFGVKIIGGFRPQPLPKSSKRARIWYCKYWVNIIRISIYILFGQVSNWVVCELCIHDLKKNYAFLEWGSFRLSVCTYVTGSSYFVKNLLYFASKVNFP